MFLIHAIEALIFLAAVYFEPTYCVRGKLWGEAFFEVRPTSYWRAELERPQIQRYIKNLFFGGFGIYQPRPISPMEQFLGYRLSDREAANYEHVERFLNKSFSRDGDAAPVLRELLGDPVSTTRVVAQLGLGVKLEIDD